MEPREHFTSVLRMEANGTVPLMLRDLTLGLDALNVPTDAVFGAEYDSELSAKCVLALQEMMGSDATMGCISSYSLEAFGGSMKYPKDGIPYASGYPFSDTEMIGKQSPSDVVSPLLRGMRRSCETVRRKRPDLALCVNVPGPMTQAGFFRGLETLLMDLLRNPDVASEVVSFAVDTVSEQMAFMTEDVADAVFFASASDNPDMIGCDDYLNYSVKNIARLVSESNDLGIMSIYHPHGVFSTEDREDILRASVAAGANGFQFAEGNEPDGIAEATAGKCAVLGGVNAFSTLLLGPDERIVRDTKRFLKALSDRHYIMTCSCSVNRGLPLNNLKVMCDTVREFNGERS